MQNLNELEYDKQINILINAIKVWVPTLGQDEFKKEAININNELFGVK